jgi:protein TonB
VSATLAARRPTRLPGPIALSAVFHVLVVGGFLWKASSATPLPPVYKVQLIAANAGPRAEGVVTDAPAPEVTSKAPSAAESKRTADTKAAKRTQRETKSATPNIAPKAASKAPPPKAGGGETGGRGADVANVNTAGIEFPFPGYLSNIVRQIALAFEVPPGAQSLVAEVSFLIKRDGSVTGIRLLTRSGSYVFDQSALGAVEAAGRAGKFGALPKEFTDDVLPVIFSFDPKRMR